MMTRKLIALMTALILSLLPLCSFAEGFSLPSSGDITLPDIDGDDGEFVLPNPGNYLGEGKLSMEDYDSGDGRIWDVYLYPHNSGWKDAVTPWINDCKAVGFEWTSTTIDEKPAYVVTVNDLSAILVPEYGDNAMLMVQEGLPIGPIVLPEADDLRLGQVRITSNGHVNTYTISEMYQDEKMTYDYYSDSYYYYLYTSSSYGLVVFYVSDHYTTGETITINRNESEQGFSLDTNEGSKRYFDTKFSLDRGRISSSNDHCDITIIYKDDSEIWCKMDGVYVDGTEELCIEFRLKLEPHQ